jgi:regulator of replication initiation timing
MENVDILVFKIRNVLKKIKKLAGENSKLKLEVEYLRKEKERSKKHLNECVVLKSNIAEATVKIEKIIKKIDTMKAT